MGELVRGKGIDMYMENLCCMGMCLILSRERGSGSSSGVDKLLTGDITKFTCESHPVTPHHLLCLLNEGPEHAMVQCRGQGGLLCHAGHNEGWGQHGSRRESEISSSSSSVVASQLHSKSEALHLEYNDLPWPEACQWQICDQQMSFTRSKPRRLRNKVYVQ